MTKNEIRDIVKSERRKMSCDEVAKKSQDAARLILESEEYRRANTIMLYSALGNEVDTAYIAEAAHADGKRVLYPVTDEACGRIMPVIADKTTEFERGAFGIKEPKGEVYNGAIDLVVVPGVAFDRSGARLGFGKGCYDAFLDKVKASKLGLCYDMQLVDALPTEAHDVNMDMIVTEREIIYSKKKNA